MRGIRKDKIKYDINIRSYDTYLTAYNRNCSSSQTVGSNYLV